MGIEYRDETTKYVPAEGEAPKPIKPGNFHNIYINPEAYREYVKSGKFPEKTMLVLDSYKAESGEPLQNLVRHFVDCIRTGKKPITDGEAGLRVVRILEAAQRSIKAQGGRITL